MQMKKVLAVIMSLCMVAGAVSYGAPIITQTITAEATPPIGYRVSDDGVVTLSGEIKAEAVRALENNPNVRSVIAEEGAVLPEDCSKLFYDFRYCTKIDLSNADTSKVTNMKNMFYNCLNLTTLDLGGFDTSKVISMRGLFCHCEKLTSVDVSGFDTSRVLDMSYMFEFCKRLETADVSGFDTSNVTSMSSMFNGCYAMNSLDVSGFDTGKVGQFDNMFCDCLDLTELDVSGFDTGDAVNMQNMFCNCIYLKELDVSGFDTTYVEDMSGMFYNCVSLTKLDVSGFDTGKVRTMYQMFDGCLKLTALDVSEFDTSHVITMRDMFAYCRELTELDLSSFDLTDVKDMFCMFTDCKKLKTLTLGENFMNLTEDTYLPNDNGWVNVNDPKTIVSGDGEFAFIKNRGKNTYKRLPLDEETKITYPTNIKVEYSKEYHQVRFTWDKVEGADRYGIAVYLAGKWRVQTQTLTNTTYTSPKNLTPGKSYRVAIAARVNGKWDTANAIKHSVTVTIR